MALSPIITAPSSATPSTSRAARSNIAGPGLAALAGVLLVGAVVDRVEPRARAAASSSTRRSLTACQVGLAHQPEGDPTLVGDDDDLGRQLVEGPDRLAGAGQQSDLVAAR